MRPSATEGLRAIAGAIGEQLVPELQTAFAQEASSAAAMMVESLAAEADTLVEDLVRDNEMLRGILSQAQEALRNADAGSLVSMLDGVLSQAGDGRLAVSSLTDENNRLRGALAEMLEHCEDVSGESGSVALDEVRAVAYRHLRQVAVRGWSFFDVSGFRERMVAARAEAGQ